MQNYHLQKGNRWRFRQLLSSQAEWCAANGVEVGTLEIPLNAAAFRGMVHRARGQKGKKKGGGDRFSGYGTFSSAALLFPRLSVGGAHHSAANAVSERNPLLAKALDHPAAE